MHASTAFDLTELPATRAGDWSDYPRGILCELQAAKIELPGADLVVTSDIPAGAGLSSSASFEVALALAMLRLGDALLPRLTIARLAQRAEVDYAGTRSGIMDQFVVLFGAKDCALLLDTRSLTFELVKIPADARIVICNTMVSRELAGGAYNQRRDECEQVVEALRRWYPEIHSLRDVTEEQLTRHAGELSPLLLRRARHVVTENARVVAAAARLAAGDLAAFGTLMDASHASLRDDYEVSCAQLDAMVEIARACEGVYGARMTGGGFGGCTVNLVAAEFVPAFYARVPEAYRARTGIAPELYDGTPAAGATYE